MIKQLHATQQASRWARNSFSQAFHLGASVMDEPLRHAAVLTTALDNPRYVRYNDWSALSAPRIQPRLRRSLHTNIKKVVTMQDVARAANVSQTTVSLVLNKRESSFLSEATRNRVLAIALELGYRPNPHARALVRGQTNTTGLWIQSLHSAFYMQLLHDIDEQVTAGGYAAIITRNVSFAPQGSIMQEFPLASVDGIIAVDIPAETVVHFISTTQTPIVSVGNIVTQACDSVHVELVSGMRDALSHIYATGRRKITLLIDRPSHSVGGGDRLATYLAFMEAARLPVDLLVSPGQLHEEARATVAERLATGPHPDALVCYNDDMALGANRALHDASLRIPEDMALVGCDDIDEARFMDPPLNTISQPRGQIAAFSWDLLQQRIADPGAPLRHCRLSAVYTKRQSV